VVLDGALTLRTRDTPGSYLQTLGRLASDRRTAIVALSKQSDLLVRDRSVRFWLDDAENRCCYRWLGPLLRGEGAARSMGQIYASRLSPAGPTFRLDIKPAAGESPSEVADRFFSSCFMRGGYPDILVRAHAYSYFTPPDVLQLQAQAGARYGLIPQQDVDLSGIFGPFGGRFK
jgi:hypothetical protein